MIQHHKHLSIDLLLPNRFSSEALDGLSSSAAPAVAPARGDGIRATSRKLRGSTDVPVDVLEEGWGRSLQLEAGQPQQLLRVNGTPAFVTLTATGIEWVPICKLTAAAPAATEAVPFSEVLSVQCPPRRAPGPLAACMPCLPARPRTHTCEVLTFQRSSRRRCEWEPRRVVLAAAGEEAARDWCAACSAALQLSTQRGSAVRPKSLLVLLNPNSGRRHARQLYRTVVAPVFAAAGIRTAVRETQHQGHAAEMVEQLGVQDLRGIDGIVCVGGDGVFHEALNGIMHARAAATASSAPDAAELLGLLGDLRLAHIPAGSTDAVACTLHGSRSAFTAAAHVCLGDATPLDILRVDTAQGTKFSSCIAAYGFLSDVVASSESYRFLGPFRYDLVGAAKLLASASYPARVRWLEGEVGRALSKHSHTVVCGFDCGVCRTASFLHANRLSEQHTAAAAAADASFGSTSSTPQASPVVRRRSAGGLPAATSSTSLGSSAAAPPSEPVSPVRRLAPTASGSLGSASPHFLQPAAGAAERQGGEQWREVEGEYNAVMLICMPCRSEKTKSGMARYGHLADGRLKLVLVHKCSPLQYLRFLFNMSRDGLAPGQLPYVTVLDAVAVQVEPLGGGGGVVPLLEVQVEQPPGQRQQQQLGHPQPGRQRCSRQSCWNLDGELVQGPDMRIAAECHQGLLRVFSRGVEQ